MKKLIIVMSLLISSNVHADRMSEIAHEMAIIDGRAPIGSTYNGGYYSNPSRRIDHRIRPHIDRGGNYHDRFGYYSDGYVNGNPTSCYTDRYTGIFNCTSR